MGRTAQTCVTPLLWLGDSLDVPHRLVHTSVDAVAAIQAKIPAVLPADDWGTALETLVLAGLDRDTALDRIHHARFGRCLLLDEAQPGPDLAWLR